MDNEILEQGKKKFPFKIVISILISIMLLLFFFNSLPRIESYLDRHFGPPKIAENIKVTFPEGSTNMDMANILRTELPIFNKKLFLDEAVSNQGYLFPDTYLFYKNETPESIISRLKENFNRKAGALLIKNNTTHSEKEIIIMASILEKEARGEDMKIVSGILWKRLQNHIALQVDADMSTYKNPGLSEEPISNPGLTAIDAALFPTNSPYLYYLHDKNGMIHFATTFAEHKRNIAQYLK